jgi:hypothetical protein
LFLEKISAAIANVDGSSGAIGAAVNAAVGVLVPIIAGAPADEALRGGGQMVCCGKIGGYEITGLDVREAHDRTMRAAEIIGCRENALSRIRKLAAKNSDGGRILAAILRQDPGGMR